MPEAKETMTKCVAQDTFEDMNEYVKEDEATGKIARSFENKRYNKGETYAVPAKLAKRLIKMKLLKAA